MNHIVAAILITDHHRDLIREADESRRANLVRGTRRSRWSAFTAKLAAIRGGAAGSTRRERPAAGTSTTTGTRPAAAA
jgi:hypothetical protein